MSQHWVPFEKELLTWLATTILSCLGFCDLYAAVYSGILIHEFVSSMSVAIKLVILFKTLKTDKLLEVSAWHGDISL